MIKVGDKGNLGMIKGTNFLKIQIPGEPEIVLQSGENLFLFKGKECYFVSDKNEPEKEIEIAEIPGYKLRIRWTGNSYEGDWERIDSRKQPK